MELTTEGKKKFSEVVRNLRGKQSQTEFGRLLGVSHSSIGCWESGAYLPDNRSLLKVAKMAGYTLEEFILYVEGKPITKRVNVEEIARQMKEMSLHELAVISRAASERLAAIAESVSA